MPREGRNRLTEALARLSESLSGISEWRERRRRQDQRPLRSMLGVIPFWMRGLMLMGFGVTLAVSVAVSMRYYTPPAPAQPIAFSHRFHVASRQLSCFFCHPRALQSANAGVPSVQKCMLCHTVIIPQFPQIRTLHGYYNRREPVPWKRVNNLPDFAHFSHQIHLARGFDCSECHGNVRAMDRVRQAQRMDMNFCVKCHWRNGASSSCYTCHY